MELFLYFKGIATSLSHDLCVNSSFACLYLLKHYVLFNLDNFDFSHDYFIGKLGYDKSDDAIQLHTIIDNECLQKS